MSEQLIILGNGFDLECGLKSKFSDFYEARLDKINECVGLQSGSIKFIIEKLKNQGITFWDFVLRDGGDGNWNDVETAIKNYLLLLREQINNEHSINFSFKNSSCCNQSNIENDYYIDCSVDNINFSEIKDLKNCVVYLKCLDRKDNKEDLISYLIRGLKNELHILESQFAEYLKNQLNDCSNYGNKSSDLINKMIFSESLRFIGAKILNFNYTNPLDIVNTQKSTMINIHGSLDKNIIFGIDGKELMSDPLLSSFTKTYRLLFDNQKLSKDYKSEIISNRMEYIKFYGHSLSESDYSYFKTIFDTIDLYNSSTKLIFFYKNLPEYKSSKTDMCNKVTRLLNVYGSTFDNKDHGKNLTHKLILESRLFIKDIDSVPEPPKIQYN